jgi:error-prone DNA polymerase
MGLFQIESPGQVHLLSRTRPQVFRDLVIQVALFRPGPLQGGMVNPYIERRSGRQPVEVLHASLEPVLRDTLGIVLFQEQVLEICHRFAGMSLEEADEFRRLMSRWRDPGSMRQMQEAFVAGAMATHAVPQELALAVFRQVESFVGYGFCRSHAAAFARTIRQPTWRRCCSTIPAFIPWPRSSRRSVIWESGSCPPTPGSRAGATPWRPGPSGSP